MQKLPNYPLVILKLSIELCFPPQIDAEGFDELWQFLLQDRQPLNELRNTLKKIL